MFTVISAFCSFSIKLSTISRHYCAQLYVTMCFVVTSFVAFRFVSQICRSDSLTGLGYILTALCYRYKNSKL